MLKHGGRKYLSRVSDFMKSHFVIYAWKTFMIKTYRCDISHDDVHKLENPR